MNAKRSATALRILLAGVALAAPSTAALAEPGERRVLVCRTLYNDLTAFDRRAWQATLDAAGRPFYAAPGPVAYPGPMPEIIRDDPIRLRLVALLRQNRCEDVGHYEFFQEEAAPTVVQPYEVGGIVRAKN